MSTQTDTRDQEAQFAEWVAGVLDDAKLTRRWGVRRIARESNVSYSTLYDWRNGVGNPMPDTVRRLCRTLGHDPAVPFQILGWNSSIPAVGPGEEMALKIRRIEGVLDGPLSEDKRREYESYLMSARRMLDLIIEDVEQEFRRDTG